MEKIEAFVALLATLSMASERLVEIVKGLIPWLNQKRPDEKYEGWRCAAVQILAIVAGIITASLAVAYQVIKLPTGWDNVPGYFTLGLLVSAGSGFWNSILGYMKEVKNLKKAEASK